MIKPEEIRKGNWVIMKITSKPYQIQNGRDIDNGIENNLYLPIPLTEEILIKAGFESWGTVICNDYEQFHRFVLHNAIDGSSNFEVHIINSMYGGNYVREFAYSIDSNRQHINCTNYLHNLQNAFHQASGTELKIEL